MRFVVISYAPLLLIDGKWFGYAPYIKEMNLWLKYVDQVVFVCPVWKQNDGMVLTSIETKASITVEEIPDFNFLSFGNCLKALLAIPVCISAMFRAMWSADHIHLRTPGNMGLLATVVQSVFPKKPKTAKYAGNWDPASKQPLSYRVQRRLLNNTSFAKNIQVLVYGSWPNTSKNIVPFFTASYFSKEIVEVKKQEFQKGIRLIFVGELAEGKRPLLACETAQKLHNDGYNTQLEIFGKGALLPEIEKFIEKHKAEKYIHLKGSRPSQEVKEAFRQAHFLVFASRSEGWPKVVAEAMFWGCLPITTAVSCVPQMIGLGKRGALVEPNAAAIANEIERWVNNENDYWAAAESAKKWSQEFTLDRFDEAIEQVLFDKFGNRLATSHIFD